MGFRTCDLCDTGAVQFHNCNAQSYLHILFTFFGCIMNSQCGQLPVGLIAQLVEPCTSITGVMGLNPIQA